jgi:cell pole-organizing protein PopZ
MEEILASIRRIISEDDTESPAAAAPPPVPSPEPAPAPAASAAAEPLPVAEDDEEEFAASDLDDEELELTEKVESHGDLDVYPPSAGIEAPTREPEPAELGALVSAPAAAAAAAAFGRLSGSMAMPAPGRTLEDVVRELLRPLLQQWLDENLPGIVQRAVDAEVSRIARGG